MNDVGISSAQTLSSDEINTIMASQPGMSNGGERTVTGLKGNSSATWWLARRTGPRPIAQFPTTTSRRIISTIGKLKRCCKKTPRADLLGFDACLMSMVETAYAMRQGAKTMVGSEELEPGLGWKYDDWLTALSADPTMDPDTLGTAVVKSYQSNYIFADQTATLSCTRLGEVEKPRHKNLRARRRAHERTGRSCPPNSNPRRSSGMSKLRPMKPPSIMCRIRPRW